MIGANNTISVYRIDRDVNSKEVYGSSAVIAGLSAYIEPVELQPSEGFQGESVFYQFQCFVEGKPDIRISDKIIDSDNNSYTVNGVQYFKGGDVASHTEISITKKRDDYV